MGKKCSLLSLLNKKNLRVMQALMLCMVMVLSVMTFTVTGKAASGIKLTGGMAHIQTYADTPATLTTENGISTLVLGTRGQAKRLEAVTINFKNNTGYTGTLQYRVHRQTYGWTEWVNAGTQAGTTGEGKRLEGIEIKLTGELKEYYDVRYCAHIQTYGDNQGWVYNGALAGTTGEAKRLEEIKVQLVEKGEVSTTPSVSYRVHRQTYGWESVWKKDGEVSGTTGEAKRLEGITISLQDNVYGGGITYSTHVQSYGWQDEVSDGEMSGTQGQAKRLEAIRIQLTGGIEDVYDVYYRVHAQSIGWMSWAKNGEDAGTSGGSKRLEAIQIVLVKKGNSAPSSTYGGISSVTDETYLKLTTPVVVYADPGCYFDDDYAYQVLDIMNQRRAEYGLSPLTMNEKAMSAAKVRAKELVTLFSHTRPNGTSCETAFSEVGIVMGRDCWTCGENIAAGQIDPSYVMTAWMNSSGHKANILNANFNQVGIACYIVPNDKNQYYLYWVQDFIGTSY